MPFISGLNTQGQTTWDDIRRVHYHPDSVPITPTDYQSPIDPLKPITLKSNLMSGTLSLQWWLDPTNGLSVQSVYFHEKDVGPDHILAEFIQWRNLRLIFPGEIPVQVPLTNRCTGALVVEDGFQRNGKEFGFFMSARSSSQVADPQNPQTIYDVDVTHSYVIAMPASDLEPTNTVHTIKVYPTLTVSVSPHGLFGPALDVLQLPTPPDIAADLKMVHRPQITRNDEPTNDGQRRPWSQYNNTQTTGGLKWQPGDVIAYLVTDTNDTSRRSAGMPGPPNWDDKFDYALPGLETEIAFDAVVYPRGPRHADPSQRPNFHIDWQRYPPVPVPDPGLQCFREPGQGEYDNFHVSPYVGFDDPSSDAGSSPDYPLIEAPIAADEVIHLHWRWGRGIPDVAIENGKDPTGFRGWDDTPTDPARSPLPNQIDGAPLIPPNQSLRIKVAQDRTGPLDNADPPGPTPAKMATDKVALWYCPRAHAPKFWTPTQFFGQGFGLAMRFEGKSFLFGLFELTNSDLLSSSLLPSYHSLRWYPLGTQLIPTATPDLSRNMLSIPGAPQKSTWP